MDDLSQGSELTDLCEDVVLVGGLVWWFRLFSAVRAYDGLRPCGAPQSFFHPQFVEKSKDLPLRYRISTATWI